MSTFSQQVRGRGARSNATGRFESQSREAFDDGWTGADAAPPALRTTVTSEAARTIITKSALIQRDLDLLRPMAARNLVRVAISITTLDRKLARSMEPRAATPERRLDAVRRLSDAGVPVVVMFAPAIPGLNDHELESVLDRAADAGAVGAGYVALRLPLEIKTLFREWLESDHPDRAARVMSLVRQMRGGKDYDADWSQRMKGQGPIADLLSQRFKAARRRYGLDRPQPPLDLSQFRAPARAGDQMDLFAAG